LSKYYQQKGEVGGRDLHPANQMQAGAEVEEGAERYEACSRAKKYSAKYIKDRLVASKLVCSRNGGQEASGWRKDKGQGREDTRAKGQKS
jgi:hypothetical protein